MYFGAVRRLAEHDGFDAALCAASYEHFDIVYLMLDKGFDINTKSATGHSLLSIAILLNNIPAVTELLRRGADKRSIVLNNRNCQQPQMLALWPKQGLPISDDPIVQCGYYKTLIKANAYEGLSSLVKLGADINAVDDEGKTPLDYALNTATSTKNWRTVEYLLDHGAIIKSIETSLRIYHCDEDIPLSIVSRLLSCPIQHKDSQLAHFNSKASVARGLLMHCYDEIHYRDLLLELLDETIKNYLSQSDNNAPASSKHFTAASILKKTVLQLTEAQSKNADNPKADQHEIAYDIFTSLASDKKYATSSPEEREMFDALQRFVDDVGKSPAYPPEMCKLRRNSIKP